MMLKKIIMLMSMTAFLLVSGITGMVSAADDNVTSKSKMSETVNRYFKLVDIAGKDKEQLDALVDLFTDDGTLTPAVGDAVSGKRAIREYLIAFYTNVSNESRHFYKITAESSQYVEADWAVAAKLKQGALFTLQGHNVFEISDDGKIKNLRVYNAEKPAAGRD